MFFNVIRNSFRASNSLIRNYCNFKEYTVPPTCNLNILLSYNTVIKPLDVIDYPESNKVIIECNKDIQCNQIGDSLNISSSQQPHDKDVVCMIRAPIKCNCNITTHGDISVSNLQGDAIRLFSQKGNVTIENTHNEILSARTNDGNITTAGTVEAYKIELKTLLEGKIFAKKIKCLGLKMETDNGEIETKSCYSDQSFIRTKMGNLNLENVHKHCKVVVENDGRLKMTGFNGTLELKMQKGNADIQISNIKDNSYVHLIEDSQLTLRLSESVIENTDVEIVSKCCGVEDDIEHEENEDDDTVSIKPKFKKDCPTLRVKCPNSIVTVKIASWADMIQKQFDKKDILKN